MQTEHIYLLIVIVSLINLAVSIKIGKRDDLERAQIIAQIIIVWIIPIVGAIGFWIFHRSYDATSSDYSVNDSNDSISANGNTTNYGAFDGGSDGGGGGD